MRLPRDLSGRALARLLEPLGYITRERGSHLWLTTQQGGRASHHDPRSRRDAGRHARRAIFDEIAKHLGITRSELLKRLFG